MEFCMYKLILKLVMELKIFREAQSKLRLFVRGKELRKQVIIIIIIIITIIAEFISIIIVFNINHIPYYHHQVAGVGKALRQKF